MAATAASSFPIIDSHIHLYAASHLPTLNWATGLSVDHVLYRQNSIPEYRAASRSHFGVLGFVFVETDRISGLREDEWEHALAEVDFLVRAASGTDSQDEGLRSGQQELVLGIVPWAPVPAGAATVSKYMSEVRRRCGSEAVWNKVKGVRYLVQDKPNGVMLEPGFIDSLKWLGNNHLTFDLGVDARSGGLIQLQEACEMLARVHDEPCNLKVIINHFCKPNLRLSVPAAPGGHPAFTEWAECIRKMASYPGTFMKLSGFFSELPPQSNGHAAPVEELAMHVKPWTDVVFDAFTPSRIMFGSDWPVVNINGPSMAESWTHWVNLVAAILDARTLSTTEKHMIWSRTALDAYHISPPPQD